MPPQGTKSQNENNLIRRNYKTTNDDKQMDLGTSSYGQ